MRTTHTSKEPKMYPHHSNGGNDGYDQRKNLKTERDKDLTLGFAEGATATGKKALSYKKRNRGPRT